MRPAGFEPALRAWKARVLARLDHGRFCLVFLTIDYCVVYLRIFNFTKDSLLSIFYLFTNQIIIMAKIVGRISKGTVIDHIKSGNALKVANALKLAKSRNVVSLAMHLKSKRLRRKDLVKVENALLGPAVVAARIGRFAPSATVNWIRNSKVVKKVRLKELKKGKAKKKARRKARKRKK